MASSNMGLRSVHAPTDQSFQLPSARTRVLVWSISLTKIIKYYTSRDRFPSYACRTVGWPGIESGSVASDQYGSGSSIAVGTRGTGGRGYPCHGLSRPDLERSAFNAIARANARKWDAQGESAWVHRGCRRLPLQLGSEKTGSRSRLSCPRCGESLCHTETSAS